MKNVRPKNTKTLLRQFIKEKGRNYVVPSREGTPRGEPIGFSSDKYFASLYGLTNAKQKEIVQNLETSHGVLRKWHTEKPFKELIDRHCREFAGVFLANIRDRIKRRQDATDSFLTQSLQKIASSAIPSFDNKEISDADIYSRRLISFIDKAIMAEFEKALSLGDVTMQLEIYATYGAMNFYRRIKMSPQEADAEKRIKNKLLKSVVEQSAEILLKPTLNDEDKKELLTTMKLVIGSLE